MADSKDDPIPRPAARPAVPPFRGPSGTPHSPLRPVTPSERSARPPFMPPPVAGRRPATPAGARPAAVPPAPPMAPRAPVQPMVSPPAAPMPIALAPVAPPEPLTKPQSPTWPATHVPESPFGSSTPAGLQKVLPSIDAFTAQEPLDPRELPEPTWDDSDKVYSERPEPATASDDPSHQSDLETESIVTPSVDEGIETYDDALGFGSTAYDVSLPAEAALQDTSTYPTAGLDLSAFAEEPQDQAGELLAATSSAGTSSDSLTEWEPRSSGGYHTGEAEIYAPEPPAAWDSSTHASSASRAEIRGAADALESVARRIRRGELTVQDTGDEEDETSALAAVLLALIRQRR